MCSPLPMSVPYGLCCLAHFPPTLQLQLPMSSCFFLFPHFEFSSDASFFFKYLDLMSLTHLGSAWDSPLRIDILLYNLFLSSALRHGISFYSLRIIQWHSYVHNEIASSLSRNIFFFYSNRKPRFRLLFSVNLLLKFCANYNTGRVGIGVNFFSQGNDLFIELRMIWHFIRSVIHVLVIATHLYL